MASASQEDYEYRVADESQTVSVDYSYQDDDRNMIQLTWLGLILSLCFPFPVGIWKGDIGVWNCRAFLALYQMARYFSVDKDSIRPALADWSLIAGVFWFVIFALSDSTIILIFALYYFINAILLSFSMCKLMFDKIDQRKKDKSTYENI